MPEKQDRRVRKTKAQLLAGLIKLARVKSIKDISVRELVDEVDINRSTFYLHYADIYDMVEKIETELIENCLGTLKKRELEEVFEEDFMSFMEAVFTIMAANADICYVLLSPNGDIAFTNKVKGVVYEKALLALQFLMPKTTVREDLEMATSFLVSGCVGMIETWLASGAKVDPKHMARLTYNMVKNGTNQHDS